MSLHHLDTMILIFKFTVFLCLAVIINTRTRTFARKSCPCAIDPLEKSADCDGLQMKTIPECIPSSTKLLILTNTPFEEVRQNQFEKFKNLEDLDLSFNRHLKFLHSGAFWGLSNLKVLQLNFDNLQTLNRSSFIGLPKLQELSIYGSAVEHISDYSLSGLSSLKLLQLNENKLKYINQHSFSGLSSLKVLSMSYNPVNFSKPFPAAIFSPLINLEELQLVGVCKYSCNCIYRDEQLGMLPSLKRLYIDGLPIVPLGGGLSSLRHLEELVLGKKGYCTIEEISNTTFLDLRHTPVSKLYIENCITRTILPYSFAYLSNLTRLNFEHNSICLEGLHNLTIGLNTTSINYLKVSGLCPYSTPQALTATSLEGLKDTSLENLDLSDCSIYTIKQDTYFVIPKSLKYINLQHNYINVINLENLQVLTNLLKLDMNDQRLYNEVRDPIKDGIEELDNEIAINHSSTTTSSKYMYASGDRHNNVGKKNHKSYKGHIVSKSEPVIRVSNGTFKGYHKSGLRVNERSNDCISMPPRLQSIDISYSRLLYYILRMFCDPKNYLEVLTISHQKRFDDFVKLWKRLKNLPMLRVLILDSNGIRDVPSEVFSPLRCLEHLSLANNALVTLSFDIKSLKHLDFLNLSGNKIQYILIKFTREIEYIAKTSPLSLILSNNILFCDCNRVDFVLWLKDTHVIDGKESLTCKYQNGSLLSLRSISDIHDRLKSECIASTVVISCTTGFLILTLILSLVAVIYNKRWNFRYLLIIGRRTINPYHPLEDCNIELEYDVYISYDRDYVITGNETLHEFVTQKLYPYLERRRFKVLIRDELQIGMRLYNVISKAVRNSKKVIILLSNNYCKDYWNVYEFNIAIMEGIYTKRQVVIPVVLEPLNPQDLHEELYSFLTSELVPRYTSDMGERLLIEYLCERIR